MKRCSKLPEPPTLRTYRQAKPQQTWDQMRDDPFDEGQQAYIDCKYSLIRGQRCLCAYCEIRIAEGTDHASIDMQRHEQRVEHFHPKSDQQNGVNWALHWPNIWAVCHGGSQKPPDGVPIDATRYLEPLPDNLSCDAFKDHQIRVGKLPEYPEGWILAPDEIPAFPLLVQFAPNGSPEPHVQNCDGLNLANNHYQDPATLVAKTIEHLNLGCPRLNRNRSIVKAQLEKQIARARHMSPGAQPEQVLLGLARRLFAHNTDEAWPAYFSMIRWRLGEAAEEHLRSINYRA